MQGMPHYWEDIIHWARATDQKITPQVADFAMTNYFTGVYESLVMEGMAEWKAQAEAEAETEVIYEDFMAAALKYNLLPEN